MEVLEKKYGTVETLRLNYFQLGRSYLKEKQYSQAENAFLNSAKLAGDDPLDWELDYYLGQCYQSQNKPEDAARYYIAGAFKSQDNFLFLFDVANSVLTNVTPSNGLLNFLETEVGRHPLNEVQQNEVQAVLGRLNLNNNSLSIAEQNFLTIKHTAPKHLYIKALEGLGEIYFKNEKYDAAKEKLNIALSLVNDDREFIEILILYIRVHLATGNLDEAGKKLASLKRLLSPKINLNTETKIHIAMAGLQLGLWKDAIDCINELSDTEKNELAYSIKVESCIAIHNYAEAQVELERGLQAYPLSDELFFFKIQLNLEGRLNIREGVELFPKEFLPVTTKEAVISNLKTLNERRVDDGNAQFFIGFIYFLLDEDTALVREQIQKARMLGVKLGIGENQSRYADIGLFILQGYVDEKEGMGSAASLNFYEAGIRYYWQAEYDAAVYYLEIAHRLNEHHRYTTWYLADAMRINSGLKLPPYYNEAKINQAYQLFNAQPDKVVRTSNDAWGYIVATRIHEIRFNFATERIDDEFWNAILYIERALIHAKDRAIFWSDLGRHYSYFGLFQLALDAHEIATSLDPTNTYILENKTAALLDSGKLDEGIRSIDELKKLNNMEYLSWRAYIDYKKGEYRLSIDKINEVLKKSEADLWSLSIKMLCFFYLESFAEAREVAKKILSLRALYAYKKQEVVFALAAFMEGRTSEAIALLEAYCRMANNPFYESTNLCLFYLYANQVEKATEQINHYLNRKLKTFGIRQFLQELHTIEKLSASEPLPHHNTIVTLLHDKNNGWIERVEKRIKELENQILSPEDELAAELEQSKPEKGSVAWLAIHASFARLMWDKKEYAAAYERYQELLPFSKDFPDVEFAMQKIYGEIIQAHKDRLRKSDFNSVLTELNKKDVHGPEIIALLIVANVGQANRREAEVLLGNYLKECPGSNDIKLFSDTLVATIPDDRLFWEMSDLVDSCKNDGTREIHALFDDLNDSLNSYWIGRLGKGQSTDMLPVVTPIALEISADLIPQGAETEWPVFKNFIPDLRNDLQKRYGVTVPGIRVRSNETALPKGTYIIMIDEIPVVSGNVQLYNVYVPDKLDELSRLKIPVTETVNPLSGGAGAFVNQTFRSLLEENHIEFWNDPFIYITRHIEAQLVQRLDYFFDVDYTDSYLQDLKECNLYVHGIAMKIRSDSTRLIRFDKVLRGLLKEQVSVTNKDAIIRSFDRIDSAVDPVQLIQQIRLELKSMLPGNSPPLKRVPLPIDLEKKIEAELKKDNNKTFLAMEPETCQQLLTEIRTLTKDQRMKSIVLEVESTPLRPYVSEFVRLEFADLMVIAKQEILQTP